MKSGSRPAIILSHSGKQHSYYTARALNNLGVLKRFYTSSYISSPVLQSFIERQGLHYWSRRFLQGLSGNVIKPAWGYEVKELVYRRLFGNSKKVNELVLERDISFDRNLSAQLAKMKYDIFWGYQGSCYESLHSANKSGKVSICEMTTAHLPFAQKILREEANIYPEWADSLDFADFPSAYEKRLIEEPLRAKKVIAISEFLKHSLVEEGMPEEKIDIILLGFDAEKVKYVSETPSIKNRPLRLLFAGKITQRKGIQYLLDAMKGFSRKDVELTFIGNLYGSGQAFKSQLDNHTYIPGISQAQMFEKYCEFDVLVFPSILEGFGLVTVEAMGAGLPVITTPNTNAYEILKSGYNGYLVPVRDSSAIARAIRDFREMDDDQFNVMKRQARETALNYTWNAYEQQIERYISKISIV